MPRRRGRERFAAKARELMARRAIRILWPAFVVAAALDAIVFSLVDPAELRWFGGTPIELSAQAVYTLGFLVFWAAIAVSGAVTALLSVDARALNAPRGTADAGDGRRGAGAR